MAQYDGYAREHLVKLLVAKQNHIDAQQKLIKVLKDQQDYHNPDDMRKIELYDWHMEQIQDLGNDKRKLQKKYDNLLENMKALAESDTDSEDSEAESECCCSDCCIEH